MKSAKLSDKAYATFMFLAISLLAGVLLSGVAVPFVAMASGTVRATAESFEYLPAEFEAPPQSERSRILMADGQVLSQFYDENRIYKPLDEISKYMRDAQVAIEDHRFYEHGAVDPEGMVRAFLKTITGDTQGASTLTQQYVKLVRVEKAKYEGDEEAAKAAVAVSIERKIEEMRYAMAVEKEFTKDEILERYLNIAYYGNGAYGVEAAALQYFGVHAKDLDLAQSAMLAGLVQNPVGFNPAKNTARAINRRDQVLNRMAAEGFVTKEEAAEAKKVGFDPEKVTRTPNGCVTAKYPFLCDYVYRTLVNGSVDGLGDSREERINTLKRGGLTIQTLIDPTTQDAAEKSVSSMVSPTDPVIGNTVVLRPDGLIVAMAQSRPKMGTDKAKGETFFNYNVTAEMGGAEGYQSGSTMKVFAAAAALEAGMSTNHTINAPGRIDIGGTRWKGCGRSEPVEAGASVGNLGGRNYGDISMLEATRNSVNTYYVRLTQAMGNCPMIEMALKTGVKLADDSDMRTDEDYIATWVLGVKYVSPMSMAEGYATFANRGVHCTPRILQKITTAAGKELAVPDGDCKQVVDPVVADGVSYLLSDVMNNGTGRPARLADGRPQAGKTGTTSGSLAVWFAGYTPEMVGVSMLALDSGWPTDTRPKSLDGFRLQNGTRLRGTGGGDAGQMWRAAMTAALKDKPKTAFTKPTDRVLEGKKVPVPDVSGMSYEEAKKTIEAAGFSTQRWGVYSSRPAGTFLGASPSKEAPIFSTISLKVSIGPRPQPKPTVQPSQPAGSEQPSATPAPAPGPGNGNGGGNGGGGGGNDDGDD